MLAHVRTVLCRSTPATTPSFTDPRPGPARLTHSPGRRKTPRPASDFVNVHHDPFAPAVRPAICTAVAVIVTEKVLIASLRPDMLGPMTGDATTERP
jgi:hypothetical protein